jgi:hypothetical protein
VRRHTGHYVRKQLGLSLESYDLTDVNQSLSFLRDDDDAFLAEKRACMLMQGAYTQSPPREGKLLAIYLLVCYSILFKTLRRFPSHWLLHALFPGL